MSNPIETVNPEGMQTERFHFSAAARHGNVLYCSGATGTKDDFQLVEDPEAQFIQVFENVKRVLEAGGSSLDRIIEITTYHVGLTEHIRTFVGVKDKYIQAPYPAWTAIGVSELIGGALVEVKVTAAVGD